MREKDEEIDGDDSATKRVSEGKIYGEDHLLWSRKCFCHKTFFFMSILVEWYGIEIDEKKINCSKFIL